MGWWFVLLLKLSWWSAGTAYNSSDIIVAREEQFLNTMQEVSEHCSSRYSPNCMRFQLLSQMERALSSADCEVLPGVFLSHNTSEVSLPPHGDSTLGRGVDVATLSLNRLLAKRICDHVRSWKLTVPVFGNHTLQELTRTLDLYLTDQDVQTGRRSKFWKYMGSALLTLMFSLLSALVSKALTLSIVAIALTVLGGGVGGFGFGPAYPAYRAPAPPRSHQVDFQYEGEDQPYVYVNRKSWKTSRSFGDYNNMNPYYRSLWDH